MEPMLQLSSLFQQICPPAAHPANTVSPGPQLPGEEGKLARQGPAGCLQHAAPRSSTALLTALPETRACCSSDIPAASSRHLQQHSQTVKRDSSHHQVSSGEQA